MGNAKKVPTCPHCGYEFDDDETWYGDSTVGAISHGDGDISDELTCPNLDCLKKFYLMCTHIMHYEHCDEDGDTFLC